MLRCFVECPRICFERVQKFLDFLIEWARIFALREYLKKKFCFGRDFKNFRFFYKMEQNFCFERL